MPRLLLFINCLFLTGTMALAAYPIKIEVLYHIRNSSAEVYTCCLSNTYNITTVKQLPLGLYFATKSQRDNSNRSDLPYPGDWYNFLHKTWVAREATNPVTLS